MPRRAGKVVVAAGTNGAGKSSIAAELATAGHLEFFNPDAYAARLVAAGKTQAEANAIAWRFGYDALRTAVDKRGQFGFETTLGGDSIVRELHRAIDLGLEVHVFYVGLCSPELHIARVKARVARGGHDIPEAKIRERYGKSVANLVGLLGRATSVHVFDNSDETSDGVPCARLVFRMTRMRIDEPDPETLLREAPEWAKPLAAAALKVTARKAGRRGR